MRNIIHTNGNIDKCLNSPTYSLQLDWITGFSLVLYWNLWFHNHSMKLQPLEVHNAAHWLNVITIGGFVLTRICKCLAAWLLEYKSNTIKTLTWLNKLLSPILWKSITALHHQNAWRTLFHSQASIKCWSL